MVNWSHYWPKIERFKVQLRTYWVRYMRQVIQVILSIDLFTRFTKSIIWTRLFAHTDCIFSNLMTLYRMSGKNQKQEYSINPEYFLWTFPILPAGESSNELNKLWTPSMIRHSPLTKSATSRTYSVIQNPWLMRHHEPVLLQTWERADVHRWT